MLKKINTQNAEELNELNIFEIYDVLVKRRPSIHKVNIKGITKQVPNNFDVYQVEIYYTCEIDKQCKHGFMRGYIIKPKPDFSPKNYYEYTKQHIIDEFNKISTINELKRYTGDINKEMMNIL